MNSSQCLSKVPSRVVKTAQQLELRLHVSKAEGVTVLRIGGLSTSRRARTLLEFLSVVERSKPQYLKSQYFKLMHAYAVGLFRSSDQLTL